MICKECHHQPSGRFDTAGMQCFCQCHDLADAASDRGTRLADAIISYDERYPAVADSRGGSMVVSARAWAAWVRLAKQITEGRIE